MQYRSLGKSGLDVSLFSFGTATFGRTDGFFKSWGNVGQSDADRLIAFCIDRGINLFDSADNYSDGDAETILGEALRGRSNSVIVSTKTSCPLGSGPNRSGASRFRLIEACEASLKRLKRDHIDLYTMHISDQVTPVEETLRALDDLIRAGKIRYIGVSNYAAWHLMRALSVSERAHYARYIAYQGYYCLIGRDYEWELMPLAQDQGLGLMAWSPLGWGRLTGKLRRNAPQSGEGRIAQGGAAGGPPVDESYLYRVTDQMERIEEETGFSFPQIALAWLKDRPTVSTILLGARKIDQLEASLCALDQSLSADQRSRLDEASRQPVPYPYWHQQTLPERNPITSLW